MILHILFYYFNTLHYYFLGTFQWFFLINIELFKVDSFVFLLIYISPNISFEFIYLSILSIFLFISFLLKYYLKYEYTLKNH